MAITTLDFASLTDDLQERFLEASENKVAGMETLNYLFDVSDTNRKTYDYQILHGMKAIQKIVEGQDLPSAGASEGDSATWTQSRYGGIAPVTKDMRLFDLYDDIYEVVDTLTEEAFDKVDQSGADVLTNGWSTTYTDVYGSSVTSTGPDGLALFSASHSNGATSTTFSNIITNGATVNPALSRAAIVAERARALKYQDPQGLTRPIFLDTLIVGPTNEDLAERLLFSTQIPGEANNDVNSLKGKIKKLMVWERLDTTSTGTDTSAYYFMCDSSKVKKSLKMKFAERPSLDAPEEVYKNKNWDYSIDFYYSIGRGWAPYIRGSKGTNAA